MANRTADDVAELKQELAQFLLTEITSAQGAQMFRQEVSAQVASVIDKVLDERLAPALQRFEQQAAEQANALTARVDAALRRFEQDGPAGGASPEADQKIAELTARFDEMRARLSRAEEQGRRAVAQPLATPKLADERVAVAPKNTSLVPRWALWIIIILLALTALAIGNIYLERMTAPEPAQFGSTPPVLTTPPAAPASASPAPVAPPPVRTPPAVVTPAPVPPQNSASNPAVTPTPMSNRPAPPAVAAPSAPVPPPHPAHAIPADFAIERAWLAAQPFAVDGSVARHAGAGGHITTLKSLACGHSVTCTADSLLSGSDATKFIALQMLMSQINDRFCTPRRVVRVTGVAEDTSLRELAEVTRCAGLRTSGTCHDSDSKICLPDSTMVEAGDVNALMQLLRWALWKIGTM